MEWYESHVGCKTLCSHWFWKIILHPNPPCIFPDSSDSAFPPPKLDCKTFPKDAHGSVTLPSVGPQHQWYPWSLISLALGSIPSPHLYSHKAILCSICHNCNDLTSLVYIVSIYIVCIETALTEGPHCIQYILVFEGQYGVKSGPKCWHLTIHFW